MLVEESLWLREKIALLNLNPGDKILNVGSWDSFFREKKQPHIHNNIIKPLIERGVAILNTDCYTSPGIDIIGDLSNKEFIESLKNENYKCVLCSNVLEHLAEPQKFMDILKSLLMESWCFLIITVPANFPYHPDPLDNRFRPWIVDLQRNFPEFRLVFWEIVVSKASIFKRWRRSVVKIITVWSPNWKYHILDFFKNIMNYSACCIILEKK